MKKLLQIFLLWACATTIQAQQLSLFTQYRHHATILNPAMVSSDYLAYDNNISIGISYRSQWVDIKNHPVTQTLVGDYIQADGGGVALMAGGYIINDQTGPTGYTGAYGKIGGVLTDDPYYGGLAFGISAGVVQYRLRFEELRFRDITEAIPVENQSKIFPDVGLGAYFYQRLSSGWFDDDLVYAGISIPQVFGLNVGFQDNVGDISVKRIQHIYANAGLYKFFSDESFIEFSTWAKFAPTAPISVDLNIRYQMNSGFWIGTGASINGNFHLETGFIIAERLRLGYGFDYSFQTFGANAGNTHEVNLNFSFPTY